jgi:hypothetical protein
MSLADEVAVPLVGAIDATVDPQQPDHHLGPANAVEVAAGPSPCVLVIECNGDGKRRTFTNLNAGMSWTGLTVTQVHGAADGTTATAVRLRWGNQP